MLNPQCLLCLVHYTYHYNDFSGYNVFFFLSLRLMVNIFLSFPQMFVDKELATLWYMLIPTGKLIT